LPPNATGYQGTVGTAAKAALAAYDLPEPVRSAPIRLLNNAVYAVTAGDGTRFALRVHRPGYRHPEHSRSELRFLESAHVTLAGAGVQVPIPVRTRAGALTVDVDLQAEAGNDAQRATCDLLTWVDGNVRRPGGGLGVRGVHQVGRALAELHRAAEGFKAPTDFDLPTWDAEALFTEESPYRPGAFRDLLSDADSAVFDQVADRTERIFRTIEGRSDGYGIVHHDFILGNCHTVRTGQGWTVGVIDFDECGWGHFLYDLAPVMGNLYDYRHFRVLRRVFLEGYRSVRTLPVEFEAHLPVLMAARHAAQILWAAGLVHSNGSPEVDTAEHIAYRMREVRRCLAMMP
jgi:Ser/Thr protein kinase RdoA (MazF antagonist)